MTLDFTRLRGFSVDLRCVTISMFITQSRSVQVRIIGATNSGPYPKLASRTSCTVATRGCMPWCLAVSLLERLTLHETCTATLGRHLLTKNALVFSPPSTTQRRLDASQCRLRAGPEAIDPMSAGEQEERAAWRR